MKKILFFIISFSLLAVGCQKVNVNPSPQPVACTQEAKQCPDGSYVGRSGPNCEFEACPKTPPKSTSTPPAPVPPVVCPQIAKLCPDGSYVSPQGPDCKIPDCPALTSGISGYIHAGPTCPVEQIPPDPGCADRPYGNVAVVAVNSAGKQYQTEADANGNFSLTVPAGTYTVKVVSSNMLPRCNNQTAEITANKVTKVDISCDTGIR